ncbi:beta-lactamase family protein [Nocardia puris]|nr:serine hydrolase domain-containing protein [Nocardia puris]MBF6214039.1 beta-lactamase family protein [Nocardia puris]MBF6368678.1 beta-lactamase family protein [Nocardia puris]MBF6461579.1 beta-lactamase family protein [Nocardia puris]
MASMAFRRIMPLIAVIGLAGGAVACDASPASPSRGPLSDTARAAVRQVLDAAVEAGIPGVQIVVTQQGREWSTSAGVGDLATAAPFPADAHVRIGSNTKAFVAAVVLQLVAEGSVELDAPIARYLPGVVEGEGIEGDRITVRNLMQHTSGLPEYLELPELQGDSDDLLTRYFDTADLVRRAMAMPARFRPGDRAEYTNTNYLVVGLLVERVTGHTIADEVARRITDPLGLRETYFPAAGDTGIRSPHPQGYEQVGGRPLDLTHFDPSWAGSAGALISTGSETNRFFTALLTGSLVAPNQLADMRADPRPLTNRPGYAYGLGLSRLPVPCELEVWGHGGSVPGFRTFNGVTPTGRAVTVIANLRPEDPAITATAQRVFDSAICVAD